MPRRWMQRSDRLSSMCDDITRLRYVSCEHCGGTGEIEVRPSVGPYDDPTPCAVLCSACDGYGMDCVETEPIEMDDLDDGSK